jgi:predicted phosphodiesterase
VTRVAALCDIHGNLAALRAVLDDVAHERVDMLVIGGDAVGGPLPVETIERLMALGDRARFVRGNADREIVEAYDRRRLAPRPEDGPADRTAIFVAARISPSQRDFLDRFEPTVAVEVDGLGEVLFCHGSPRSDSEIITTATAPERLRGILAGVEQRVVVGGHTHRQFDRRVDGWRVINAGSVGRPYEGRAGAFWALLGPDVELRRTDYDLQSALAELRAGGFPDLDDLLEESLLRPVEPDEVAEFFERQALGTP